MEPSVHEVLNWQGNSSGDMNATSGAVAGPVAAAAEDLVQLRAELKAAQAQVDAAAADKAWGAVEELMKRVNNLREKIDRLTGSAQDGAGAGSAGDVRPADGDTMVAPPGGWGALLVCSELRLDQLPQDATAVRELLGDFTGMRIPLAQPAYDTLMSDSGRRHMKDTFVRSNELNPLLTTLVMERKSLSLTSTELNTSFAVISFFTAVFDTLREYSPVVLSDLLFLNSSERGTSSTSISKGKRPDTLVQVNSTTLLVGEEKPLVGLLFAIEDLRKKIVNLNRSHFGDVPFVLAWAASGSQIQFFIATANDKLEAVTEPWDYLSFQGRVRLIFTLAQVYRLLHVMARCLPSSVVQRQPGSKLERDSGATVLFLDDSVTKTIADFKSYCKRYGTTLAAIKKAYSAAPQPGRDVHQFLAHASTGPTDTEDKYSVVVRPLGYDVTDRAQVRLRHADVSVISLVEFLAQCTCKLCRDWCCLVSTSSVPVQLLSPAAKYVVQLM
eukprot:TRINITY_DN633_c0_g2_i3.p1 TRINITY_DN633_c0_g2~~TRINITY_DN633_c0_g2_i3.p1  ORF type:complete len:498 (+),score=75.44 TRINITY_DN633_c0_g2_i3:332-1825(+)